MDGICRIKSNFLIKEPKMDGPESDPKSTTDQPALKRPRWTKDDKRAHKGQNKSRKNTFKVAKVDNLCKTLFNGKTDGEGDSCKFEQCKFIHDLDKYLEVKPKDIDGTCYIYTTKGFCSRGITCRFAGSHLDANLNNLTADWYDPKAPNDTLNQIPYDLQVTLRKRSYNLDLSKKVIENMDKLRKERQSEISVKSNDPVDSLVTIDSKKSENDNENGMESKEHLLEKPIGFASDTDLIKERPEEKKKIDFRNKILLSPLTTVGNLPFRRICKEFGADITCGEMACAVPICNGLSQEWALAKRHSSEDIFGVQLCGNNPQLLTFACQILKENAEIDFIDLNLGCPIELIYGQGAGSALLRRINVLESIVRSCSILLDSTPFTVKTRTGVYDGKNIAHELVPKFENWGAAGVTIHGRSREQRYTKTADWKYIEECASKAKTIPVFGNGDILSFEDYNAAKEIAPHVSSLMIGRGALIKPWIFKDIKEQKHWDPSSSERFEIMRKFINYGLEHWGSDTRGVENTRKFFLEWQSFLYRYVPYGILECPPQRINERPDLYKGRDDLETLMASGKSSDWVKLSEMFLGPVPDGFSFLPKHKANAF